MQLAAESLDDYKGRLRRRLAFLRDKVAALPAGVAARLCIVCARRTRTQAEEAFHKIYTRVADDFGKGDDAVMKLDTAVEHMQSSSGSRDWEAVKQRIESCFSGAFVQRLGAYDAEV